MFIGILEHLVDKARIVTSNVELLKPETTRIDIINDQFAGFYILKASVSK